MDTQKKKNNRKMVAFGVGMLVLLAVGGTLAVAVWGVIHLKRLREIW